MVYLVYGFVVGLLFGSFANVVIYRLPRGLSIVAPPSACVACGKRLRVVDLIPVMSWMVLRGRCRYCGGRIAVRYPLVELVCGVLFACMVFYTPTFSALPLSFFAFLLVCVSIIDVDGQKIPRGLVVAGVIVAAAWIILSESFAMRLPFSAWQHYALWFPHAPLWYEALFGAAMGAMFVLFKKTPFYVVMGLFLGWKFMIIALILAYTFSGMMGIKERKLRHVFPSICGGCLLAIWFGNFLLHIYGIG